MAKDGKYFGTVTVVDQFGTHVFSESIAYPDGSGGLYVKDNEDRPVGIFSNFQSVVFKYKQGA